MKNYKVMIDAAATLDVPDGVERSCDGALHLTVREIRELTDGEADFLRSIGIPLVDLGAEEKQVAASRPAPRAPAKKLAPKVASKKSSAKPADKPTDK